MSLFREAIYGVRFFDEKREEGRVERREEIVRCRDCKHSDKGYWCRYFGKYGDLSTVTPDGFCAWGERKDDDSSR